MENENNAPQNISDWVGAYTTVRKKLPKGIHSELHEMVANLRREFGETATKGKGSFGFYLHLLKPVPMYTLNIWLSSIRDSPKLDTPLAKCKIFWWKYKNWKTGK